MMIAGKPLIGWTIEAALESKVFSRVVVSTDSWEIAVLAAQFGAEVPFMRPEELARDDNPSSENFTSSKSFIPSFIPSSLPSL